MSGKKWKLRQDGRRHYALLEDADVPANVHTPPIAFLSFVEQQHRDLIAAAPEMLEALESFVRWHDFEYDHPDSLDDWQDAMGEQMPKLRAAIAKAKGETP